MSYSTMIKTSPAANEEPIPPPPLEFWLAMFPVIERTRAPDFRIQRLI